MFGFGLSLASACVGAPIPSVFLWRPNAATTAWATDANWLSGRAPGNNTTQNTATFAQTSYTTQPDAGTRSVLGVQIGDGATATAALTLAGTALTLGAGGISMLANAAASTVSSPLTLGASCSISNAAANTLTVSGVISGSASVTFGGTGGVVISGTSGYTGATTISGGVKQLTGNLNNTSSVTISGGTLQGPSASLGTCNISNAVNVANVAGSILRPGTFGDNVFNTGPLTFAGSNSRLTIDCSGVVTSTVVVNGTCALGAAVINVVGSLTAGSLFIVSSSGAMTGTLPVLGTNTTGRAITFSQIANQISMVAV